MGLSGIEYNILQSAFYNNLLTQDTNIYEYLLSKDSTSKTNVFSSLSSHYSERIRNLNKESNDIIFSVASPIYKNSVLLSNKLSTITENGMRDFFGSMKYVHDHTNHIYSITHLLILDLSTKQGMRTLEAVANRYSKEDGTDSFDIDEIKDVRFGVINNIDPHAHLNFENSQTHYVYTNLINTANRALKGTKFLRFLRAVIPEFNAPIDAEKQVNVMQIIDEKVKAGTISRKNFITYWKDAKFLENLISLDNFVLEEIFKGKLEKGKNYVFTNGRLTLIPPHFNELPISFLKSIENEFRKKYSSIIEDIKENKEFYLKNYVTESFGESEAILLLEKEKKNKVISDIIFKTISQLEYSEIASRSNLPSYLTSRGHKDTSLINIHGNFDPLSKTARRISPILSSFKQHFNNNNDNDNNLMNIQILYTPNLNITEFPLKSYYRYVLNTNIQYNEEGNYSPSNSFAAFSNLPTKPILTLGLDTPNAWLVQLSKSKYDLDNIILDNVNDDFNSNYLFAQYQLENILVQGSCLDVKDISQYPRGIQLRLNPSSSLSLSSFSFPSSLHSTSPSEPSSKSYSSSSFSTRSNNTNNNDNNDNNNDNNNNNNEAVDTIVMSNFGYYQLKGNPGLWNIELMGRANEIYQLYPNLVDEFTKDIYKPIPNLAIPISTFLGYSSKQIFVQKKKGFENENVLLEDSEIEINVDYHLNGDLIYSQKNETKNEEMIHVFSVASGHLYERFLKIMMLSVTKTTNSKVTFWILENYISPQFKSDFIPIFKEKFKEKVNVEMVTYQWPSWLHAQTEKQRIIWAYKILFLDVLFPVDVKRIIFVDADLIVRSDLKEVSFYFIFILFIIFNLFN